MPQKRPKRSYHHGDLRRALLEAAWAAVEEGGLRGLTLREVARRVGVTHAAPYHHFRDREALVSAMAEEAFAALDAAMIEAGHEPCDPLARFARLGRAYIDFARAHPARMEVMFRRPSAEGFSASEAGARAFQHLVSAACACQEAGLAPRGAPMALALSAWSLVHGFSMLWVEGPLPAMTKGGASFEALRDDLLARHIGWLRASASRERGLRG